MRDIIFSTVCHTHPSFQMHHRSLLQTTCKKSLSTYHAKFLSNSALSRFLKTWTNSITRWRCVNVLGIHLLVRFVWRKQTSSMRKKILELQWHVKLWILCCNVFHAKSDYPCTKRHFCFGLATFSSTHKNKNKNKKQKQGSKIKNDNWCTTYSTAFFANPFCKPQPTNEYQTIKYKQQISQRSEYNWFFPVVLVLLSTSCIIEWFNANGHVIIVISPKWSEESPHAIKIGVTCF